MPAADSNHARPQPRDSTAHGRRLAAILLRGCLVLTLLLMLGCKTKSSDSGADAISGEQSKAGSFLAYEHTLDIRVPEPAARLEAARAACVAEQFGACSVLKLDLQDADAGEATYATLVLRLAPEAVEGLVGIASTGGKIHSRSTAAEDLADAVADNERRLREVESIHTRLAALQDRADLTVSDLLTLTRELASLDAQRVDLQRDAAVQRRRIETNLLTLRLNNATDPSAFAAVGDALGDGLDTLVEGTAETISFVAYGLPFLVLAFVVALTWRFLWRRITATRH